jgi:hypothetical protein
VTTVLDCIPSVGLSIWKKKLSKQHFEQFVEQSTNLPKVTGNEWKKVFEDSQVHTSFSYSPIRMPQTKSNDQVVILGLKPMI